MKYNFDEQMKNDEEKYNIGSGNQDNDYFNITEGSDNVIRILQPGVAYANHFDPAIKRSRVAYGYVEGDPIRDDDGNYPTSFGIKYAQYVLDRKDGKVKLATLPYSVQNGIRLLQQNPDYEFDEVPMPYDVRITYDKNASPANKYKVNAVPRSTELEDKVLEQLEEKMNELTPEDFVGKMKEKQKKKDQEAGTWISPEELQKENERKGLVPKGSDETTQEYPEEEINPDDIPF